MSPHALLKIIIYPYKRIPTTHHHQTVNAPLVAMFVVHHQKGVRCIEIKKNFQNCEGKSIIHLPPPKKKKTNIAPANDEWLGDYTTLLFGGKASVRFLGRVKSLRTTS